MSNLTLESLHPPTNYYFYHSFARISGICIFAAIVGSVIWLVVSLVFFIKGKITRKRLFMRALIALAIIVGTFSLALITESILETIVPRHIC